MKSIDPIWHEFDANLLYNDDGLAPFFVADSQVKAGGGSQAGEFRIDGERWEARLSYQSSNIVHPGEQTPKGTDWQLEEMREYRLKVRRHPSEDDAGQQSFVAHVAPRWPNMQGESKTGKKHKIPVPEGFGEGINVRIQGSNIDALRYRRLLRLGANAVGIRAAYFEDPHPYSNVQDAERYVRVHRNESGPVHARDGPIASLGHLLESDRQGYRKVVQNDDDGHGRNRPGYYHTVTLGERRVREAFPGNRLPVEVKHYYAREAVDRPSTDALAHPKVGVSLQVSRLDGEKVGVTDDDLEALRDELDAVLRAVLADAGLDLAPSGDGDDGCGPYVTDAYFPAEVTDGWELPASLNISRVRQEQESVVVRHLADGMSPVQWDALEVLVTDGGIVSPANIAEEKGRHVESVRRALRDMEDVVIREYGRVSLRSRYVAELVHDAVEEAREASRRAVEAGAKALHAADRGLDETMSAFVAWAARYGVDHRDRKDARMQLRFGEKPYKQIVRAVRKGFRVWTDAGMPPERFRQAEVIRADGGSGEAWRYIGRG